jgi:hypothetical protein
MPVSFKNMLHEITGNDNNYINKPAINRYLEKFHTKIILSNWNYIDMECKAKADAEEFKLLLKLAKTIQL